MEENKTKELDLLDLIRMFFRWLKHVGWSFLKLMGNCLRLMCRHWAVSIVLVGICLAVGFYLGRTSNLRYKIEAMAVLNGSTAQTVSEVTKQLTFFSPLGDFTSLAAQLGLHDSITRNIKEIETFHVIDYRNDSIPDVVDFRRRHDLTDTLNVYMTNRLYFRIKMKNVNQFPVFKEAFINYFNRHERLTREFAVKRENLEEEIKLLNAEISRLDSMATITYLQEAPAQLQLHWSSFMIGKQERQLLHEDLVYLQKMKQKREMELANFTDPVTFPDGFSVIPKPIHGKVFFLIITGLIGAFLSVMVALIIENRKKIIDYLFEK